MGERTTAEFSDLTDALVQWMERSGYAISVFRMGDCVEVHAVQLKAVSAAHRHRVGRRREEHLYHCCIELARMVGSRVNRSSEMPATRPPSSRLERSRDTWRNLALGFAVLLFLVVWAWRPQVASIRTLLREQVQNREQERAGRQLVDEERSRLIERLDLALDEMRRKEHHRTHLTTEPASVEE